MDKCRLHVCLALGMLLAFAHAGRAQALKVDLKDSNVSSVDGVECVAEMSGGDKRRHFDAGEEVIWQINGSACAAHPGANGEGRVSGKSKLIPGSKRQAGVATTVA